MSARPFSESEYATLLAYFRAQKMTRNATLLVFGCACGYRIEEILSITVGQVWTGTEFAREIVVARRHLKGGRGVHKRSVRARRLPLSEAVRAAISEQLAEIGTDNPERPLFSTPRKNAGGMHRSQAYRTLKGGCRACGIEPNRISTHTLRKTFARRVYAASGNDLIATQRIMGHTTPVTTARYLETNAEQLDALVLGLVA